MLHMTELILPDTDKRKEISMNQISEKELSAVQDILSEEDLLIKKFKNLSDQCQDQEIKNKLLNISERHQKHFNSIYSQLN